MQYIGSELQDRMNLLSIDVSTLSEITFMDEETISDIIENRISYEDVDEFDMSLICSALHCDAQYFIPFAPKPLVLRVDVGARAAYSISPVKR